MNENNNNKGHVERLPWAQSEIISNSTVDDDPGLFSKTEVNK